jgi:hypothetical protein
LTPSSWNWTPATPVLSKVVAATVVEPARVAPEAGEVMETLGGVVSLATVTVAAAEVARLPAASRATAVRVWAPLVAVVVFQGTAYGEVVSSAPRAAPSSMNCTPATATLSAAVAVTVIVPATVEPDAGEVRAIVGGVVSEPPLATVTVTGAEVVRLPAASRATAVRACEPLVAVVVFQGTA